MTKPKYILENYGFNEGLRKLWFDQNSHLPNGSFVIQGRKGNPYWYYRLGSDGQSNTKRNKYLCSCFEGTNDDGMNSFQISLSKLTEKFEEDFIPKTRDTTKVGDLLNEYIGTILKEEGSDEGRKRDTTQGIINGCRQFNNFCQMNNIILRDIKNPKSLKKIIIDYKDFCKERRNPPLKRNTIRTYIKKVRGFLEWLSDEDLGKGILPVNPITSQFISKIYPPTSQEKRGVS